MLYIVDVPLIFTYALRDNSCGGRKIRWPPSVVSAMRSWLRFRAACDSSRTNASSTVDQYVFSAFPVLAILTEAASTANDCLLDVRIRVSTAAGIALCWTEFGVER